MARVTTVKKAQKPQGNCGKCGKPIEVGDPYKWIKPRAGKFARGSKKVRCSTCPSWRPSETTSSAVLSVIYAAQENFADEIGNWDPAEGIDFVQGLLDQVADAGEEAAEMRRESAQNIEDGFGHPTYQSEELEGQADELESWAEEVRDALGSIDDQPEAEDFDESEVDVEGLDEDEAKDAIEEAEAEHLQEHEDALDAWKDEVEQATAIVDECPV